ncbi:MAG: helix-turn-helix domain-containing protein [Alphaproteobacteria bacterium]|nr:helix-turn-helix domain-containing protein [Alphaproteobacteria bacterium]
MGVIYKLKQEVIDHIIAQKKENPELSCRQIAKMASDRFDVDISKSSVNTILKRSQLSSDIGRRSVRQKRKTRQFQIPPERKEQFQETMKEFGFDKEAPSLVDGSLGISLLPDPVDQKFLLEEKGPNVKLLDTKKETFFPIDEKRPALLDRTEAHSLEKARVLRDGAQRSFSCIYPFMGAVIIKMFLLLTKGDVFLSRLVKKYYSLDQNLEFLDLFFKTALLLRALGVDDINKEESLSFLPLGILSMDPSSLAFSQLLENMEFRKDMFSWIKNKEMSQGLLNEYMKTKKDLFLDVSGFKIELEDGSVLFMDALLQSFYKESFKGVSAPFSHAISLLSECFIVNHSPFVFEISTEESCASLSEIISMLDGYKGKIIEKIMALDASGKETGAFSWIPHKRRLWIARIDKTLISKALDQAHISNKEIFYNEFSDDIIGFYQINGLGEYEEPVRGFIIEETSTQRSYALLTNDVMLAPHEILNAYFKRSLGQDVKKEALSQALKIDQKQEDIQDLWGLLGDFLKNLKNYIYKNILYEIEGNKEDVLTQILHLTGCFYQTKDLLRVRLVSPSEWSYRDACQRLVHYLNQSAIKDGHGREIRVELIYN